jgi:hypothetical protein
VKTCAVPGCCLGIGTPGGAKFPIGTPGRFHSGRPPYGLVATIDFDRTGVSAVNVRLVAVDNSRVRFRPVPQDGPEGARFLRSLVSPADGWMENPLGGLTARPVAQTATGPAR